MDHNVATRQSAVHAVDARATAAEALALMLNTPADWLAVVRQDTVIGLVTGRDLEVACDSGDAAVSVADVAARSRPALVRLDCPPARESADRAS